MPNPSTTEALRREALLNAARQITAGCAGCAEGYFAEARRHGATEEDIRQILADPAALSRRQFLKGAAGGVVGLAAVGGGLLAHSVAERIPPTPAPRLPSLAGPPLGTAINGAQVAWVLGSQSPTAGGGFHLLGIAPGATIVGSIGPLPEPPLRSADGLHLYSVRTEQKDGTSTPTIAIYDAASGALERTIRGKPIPLDSTLERDILIPGLSADGHYLALLRLIERVGPGTARRVTKEASGGKGYNQKIIGETHVITAIEIVDLRTGNALDDYELDTPAGTLAVGNLAIAPDGRHLYVARLDRQLHNPVTVLGFAGRALQIQTQAPDVPGPMLPRSDASQHRAVAFQSSEGMLVSTDGASLRWYDLRMLRLLQETTLDTYRSARPSFPAVVFAPDDSWAYGWNTCNSTVSAQDLIRRTDAVRVTLPQDVAPARAASAGAGISAAALAPDGTRLYVSDSRGTAGLAIIRLPDLQVIGRALPQRAIRDVWLAADGQTVFALGERDGILSTMHRDGTVTATLDIGLSFYGLVAAR